MASQKLSHSHLRQCVRCVRSVADGFELGQLVSQDQHVLGGLYSQANLAVARLQYGNDDAAVNEDALARLATEQSKRDAGTN